MFTEGVCSMNYHGVLAWLIARSSEREVRVGPKQKGQIVFAKTYMLGCLAAANFHMFQVLKCFSAAEYLHVTGLEGSQTSIMPHPDQQGWSHNGDHQLTFLFVFISSSIHALGCSSAIYLSFGVNTSLPCRDRSVMALFSPERTVQGRQSIQLGRNALIL